METTDSLEINLLTICNSSQPVSPLVKWAGSFIRSQLSTYLLILGLFFKVGLIPDLSVIKLTCAEEKDPQT